MDDDLMMISRRASLLLVIVLPLLPSPFPSGSSGKGLVVSSSGSCDDSGGFVIDPRHKSGITFFFPSRHVREREGRLFHFIVCNVVSFGGVSFGSLGLRGDVRQRVREDRPWPTRRREEGKGRGS